MSSIITVSIITQIYCKKLLIESRPGKEYLLYYAGFFLNK